MLFALICHDVADGFELRQQTRPAHLEFLASQNVRFAGPMLSDDQTKPIGSIVIIECDDLGAAKVIAAQDPYNKAGLFQSVIVHPFKQVIPEVS
jgi:uncharacterized protein YciI